MAAPDEQMAALSVADRNGSGTVKAKPAKEKKPKADKPKQVGPCCPGANQTAACLGQQAGRQASGRHAWSGRCCCLCSLAWRVVLCSAPAQHPPPLPSPLAMCRWQQGEGRGDKKKETKLGLTASKETDFGDWYSQVWMAPGCPPPASC